MSPFPPARGPNCPPAITLERASGGDWAEGVKLHVDGCAQCQAQLTQLASMQRDFLAARPAERFVKQLERRPVKRWPRVLAVGFAFAAALVLFVLLPRGTDDVRLKGGLVRITLKRGDLQQPLVEGTPLRAGDALRFTVQAPADGFAVVLERDGQGHVAVVAPFDSHEAVAVARGEAVLPDSAVLDAVPGREVFVTVFSRQRFELEPLLSQLSSGAQVRCDDCRVEVSTFDKP